MNLSVKDYSEFVHEVYKNLQLIDGTQRCQKLLRSLFSLPDLDLITEHKSLPKPDSKPIHTNQQKIQITDIDNNITLSLLSRSCNLASLYQNSEEFRGACEHLLRFLKLRHSLDIANAITELMYFAIDRVPMGVVLLNDLGEPLYVNRQVRESNQAEISIDSDKLKFNDGDFQQRYTRFIHHKGRRTANNTILFTSDQAKHTFVVIKLQEELEDLCIVTPISFVLFLCYPNQADLILDAELINHLGLTSKEAKVLKGILAGASNKQIADHNFVSIETIKSHTKSIYKKLQTNRKTALIGLFLNSTVL